MINLAPFTRFDLTPEQKVALCDHVLEHAMAVQVNYPLIQRVLDQAEQEILAKMRAALTVVQDDFLGQVRRKFDAKKDTIASVSSFTLRKFKAVADALATGMGDVVTEGLTSVRYEVPRRRFFDSRITVSPTAVMNAMKSKAFWVSGILSGKMLADAQSILIQAIKNGETLGETTRKITEAWLPYIGDPSIVKDAKQLLPYRLETIVRTNVTDAYNSGRLTEMRDPELADFIQAIRYSAVMDERTTEICQELNGLVFRKDDPDIDRLTPPVHFNCRSILVPVLIDEKVPAENFVTSEQVGRALDLMDANFGGSAKYEQANPLA